MISVKNLNRWIHLLRT